VTFTINNVRKHFSGVEALSGVSITAQQGQIIGIIGPNGSGKTTLLDILSGLLQPDSGTITMLGDTSATGIVRTFQTPRLFENMTVQDNFLIALQKKQVRPLLKQFGLLHAQRKLARELSFGQKKILEIARAGAMRPNILLLDEPFAGLFAQAQQKVSALIKDARKSDRIVILVEHDMRLIRELCDQVVVMDYGHVIAQGRSDQVLRNEKVRAVYLGNV
jgi:ABC-type branched-subunit amino acid transport system ATPase component